MAKKQDFVSISDASVPNAGRIYDYLLGGDHNFEVDRVAGEQLRQQFPETVQDVRLIRWFLGEAVQRLCAEGFEKFLDFASGLPTVDHIHHVAPQGTKVIYSDVDPITVSYGQEIVTGLENVAYLHADAGAPEELLEMDVVRHLMGSERKVAVGFNGISWFLPDDQIAHAFSVLYDWVERGSKLFVSAGSRTASTEASAEIADFYKTVNQTVFPRSEARIRELFGSWTVCEPGIEPLEKWLQIDPSFAQGGSLAGGVTLVGAILLKQ